MGELGEDLRHVMRHWTTGVAVVTSAHQGIHHGMTVNSFTSVSLDPPIVTVTLASATRTHALVLQSGVLAITILNQDQIEISNRFAGRVPDEDDRFAHVETFSLVTGAPLISGGLGHLDGRILQSIPLPHSTLFVIEVLAVQVSPENKPLLYFNRDYHRLPDEH